MVPMGSFGARKLPSGPDMREPGLGWRPVSQAEIRTSGALRAVGWQKKSPAAKTGLPAAMSAFLRIRSALPPGADILDKAGNVSS